MIDVKEHFYQDDPEAGHPDVKTNLNDAFYYFLGNGLILGAVQISPGGEGTAVGILLMDPECFGRKRDSFGMDPDRGLEDTSVAVKAGDLTFRADSDIETAWDEVDGCRAVSVIWKSGGLTVTEKIFCPGPGRPVFRRIVSVRSDRPLEQAEFRTGIDKIFFHRNFSLAPGDVFEISLDYTLNPERKEVRLDLSSGGVDPPSGKRTKISFGESLLDRFFESSVAQMPAVIGRSGKMDASIWQYNHEWVRDQSMMAHGLILAGYPDKAEVLLERLLRHFVSSEGDCVDSGKRRDVSEVELDQNGELLYVLRAYVCWTGKMDLIRRFWEKIVSLADFPLKDCFRHPSGLLCNRREYWERHRAYGITDGCELAHQVFVTLGLEAAADLARSIGKADRAKGWEKEAARLKSAVLEHPRFRLIDKRGFIKRRTAGGEVQETIDPLPEANLPEGVPLALFSPHYLNPDTSAALPIALGFVSPEGRTARSTMNSLEKLWNLGWETGGYGRYHTSSEPDSPGAWPFPSLFLARAYSELGEGEKVWRVLRWLDGLPGGHSGTWLEFYGERKAPPFPQVGFPPWNWAEVVFLLVHHIIGMRPGLKNIEIQPRWLDGLKNIRATFPVRGRFLRLDLAAPGDQGWIFTVNGAVAPAAIKVLCLDPGDGDIHVEAKTCNGG